MTSSDTFTASVTQTLCTPLREIRRTPVGIERVSAEAQVEGTERVAGFVGRRTRFADAWRLCQPTFSAWNPPLRQQVPHRRHGDNHHLTCDSRAWLIVSVEPAGISPSLFAPRHRNADWCVAVSPAKTGLAMNSAIEADRRRLDSTRTENNALTRRQWLIANLEKVHRAAGNQQP